jgi:hypothetical protein
MNQNRKPLIVEIIFFRVFSRFCGVLGDAHPGRDGGKFMVFYTSAQTALHASLQPLL